MSCVRWPSRRTPHCLCLLLITAAWIAPDSLNGDERPNIVLILCDDMGFSDLGCYGGEVETPHLDRLARDGMRFTQFYNNAKCTTTRASLVTGLYPRFDRPHLRTNMVTLGEVLQAAGYATALCGKWHLGRDEQTHPYHRGFQSFYGLLDGCCNFFNPSLPDPPYKGSRIRYFARNDERITEFDDHFYTTDAFTDHAIDAIHQAHNAGKPFFVHVAYTAPHYPLHAKPHDIAKYRGRYRDGWNVLRARRWSRQQQLGMVTSAWKLTDSDSRAYDWNEADHDFEDLRMAVYAAMIDAMDQNIGRICQTLHDTGHGEDTIILFLSDNGGCAEEPGGRDPQLRRPGPADEYVAVGPAWGWAQNTPFRRYKTWMHEGGIATPFIAWWPGHVPAGQWNRHLAHIIDIMPTLVDLAETEYPGQWNGEAILPVEGTTMVPLLRGETRDEPKQLAWYWSGNRALRQGPWKIVWDKLGNGDWELYRLDRDRCETQDLASSNPERVARMSDAWLQWAEEMGCAPE